MLNHALRDNIIKSIRSCEWSGGKICDRYTTPVDALLRIKYLRNKTAKVPITIPIMRGIHESFTESFGKVIDEKSIVPTPKRGAKISVVM